MTEQPHPNTTAAIAVNYIKETSRARREAAEWRSLFLQVLRILGERDQELREACEHLTLEQRDLLEQAIHEFSASDRELLMLTLSLLDHRDRQRTNLGWPARRAA